MTGMLNKFFQGELDYTWRKRFYELLNDYEEFMSVLNELAEDSWVTDRILAKEDEIEERFRSHY